MAADPDPYFALPSLYGAPAYARAPKCVPDAERPVNPDDLPIAAEQSEEERALAEMLQASGSYQLTAGLGLTGAASGVRYGAGAGSNGSRGSNGAAFGAAAIADGTSGGRRLNLRTLTARLGSRPK